MCEREEGAVSSAHVPGGWCSYTAAFIQVTAALDYLTGESLCPGK